MEFLSKRLQESIDPILQTTDPNEVSTLMGDFLSNYDVKMFTAALIRKDQDKNEIHAEWLSNTTKQHAEDYLSEGWIESDYGVRASAFNPNSSPFLIGDEFAENIQDLKQNERSFYKENALVGLKAGLSIPIATKTQGIVGGFSIWADMCKSQFRSMIKSHGLELITFLFLCNEKACATIIADSEKTSGLSVRELDCLSLIAKGYRPDDIADKLCIATVTVNFHIQSARKKLEARTNSEAVAKLIAYRLI